MRKYIITILAIALVASVTGSVLAEKPVDEKIVSHPRELVYPDMEYNVPPVSEFRTVLSNGMVVFIAEDRMLPTFDMQVIIRTGGAFDPAGKEGLASLTGGQIRDGGTKTLSPAELDDRVEFLAAALSSGAGDTKGQAGLSLLAKDVDEGLGLLIEMLRYPRFDEERFRKAKDSILQNIKRRNDSTENIEGIEWSMLMDGEDHFSNRYPSTESINSITRDDMIAFHQKYYHPANMIIAVAGDFDRDQMLKKLETAFADWPAGEPAPKTFAKPDHQPVPGVYVVQKDDVNQARVSIGHKSIMRGTPDYFPCFVMNGILGGAGFQSRLMKIVRAKEGLAYTVGSSFGQGTYYPGDFQCYLQTKSNACAYATKLVLEQINRLRTEKVGEEELQEAISLFAEYYPQFFETKMALLGVYANDEYTDRDSVFWQNYVKDLRSVTADDVLRVAKKYLHPDKLVFLAVGDTEAILKGGHDKAPDVKMDEFGKVTKWQVRDPNTLKR